MLVDLEIESEDSSNSGMAMPMDKSKYPYGLCLTLDEATLKKLGIEELPEVESYIMIKAKTEVCSVSNYENKDGENRGLVLQIVALELGTPKKEIDPDKIYDNKG
jgi:hypothetical protein